MSSFLEKLYNESLAYSSVDSIESLVEEGNSLEMIPVQPLYFALKKLPSDQISLYLEKLSPMQRKVILDIELWTKDKLDVESFHDWFLAYAHCPNAEIRYEFIQSEEFLLFLKGRFGVHTFDVHDPVYPDHDNYFLTDDSQLLIEFDEDFTDANELKLLVAELYDVMGVEGAYTYLFKMITDSFLIFMEDSYQQKIKDLSDFGIVDYYQALETLAPFASLPHVEYFVKTKKVIQGDVSQESANQIVSSQYLVKLKDELHTTFEEEFDKISDVKKFDWMRFNFVRLVNSKMVFDGQLKQGSIGINKTSREVSACLKLGLNYVISKVNLEGSIFDRFTFVDLFRIGNSLVQIEKKRVEKVIRQYDKGIETFWGQCLNNTFENLLETPIQVGDFAQKPTIVNSLESYQRLAIQTESIVSLLPIVNQFYQIIKGLIDEGTITASFYLNYTLEDIDFEAVIISTFMNFTLGYYKEAEHEKKLGIKVDNFKSFLVSIFGKCIFEKGNKNFIEKTREFAKHYGLDQISSFEGYFVSVIEENLTGYEFDHLSYDDYKHIGGPIFLCEN